MKPILAGIETEYGLYIEGRGAENQIDDAKALVRSYSDQRFFGWDYRYESPRADLRGFRLNRLAVDPVDAQFDRDASLGSNQETRSDQVLANGARFYNDHGHPEYATPECLSLSELALHDLAGEQVVLAAAREFADSTGQEVRIYKNNTDFHGASYGTHESYLTARSIGFEALYRAVMPMLIARTFLCGAGKVASEAGEPCSFQLSQRADFIVEAASADTLYRRPLFNTRDEPHADPERWLRLHVISGDANRIASATRRKVGLVKLALALCAMGEAPEWRIPHPARAFSALSRSPRPDAAIELDRRSWTTVHELLESYFSAAERGLGIKPSQVQDGMLGEFGVLIAECRQLLKDSLECPDRFRRSVDWAAKRWMMDRISEDEGREANDPSLLSYDLEYHRLGDDGIFDALVEMDEVERSHSSAEAATRIGKVFEPTRARARSLAVTRFSAALRSASWRSLVFDVDGRTEEVELPPDSVYPEALGSARDVEDFIAMLRNLK